MGGPRRLVLSLPVLLLACASAPEASPEVELPRIQSPSLRVDADWVANHGGRPQVRVLQVGEDPEAFATGHLPGAGFLDLSALLGPDGLPSEGALARTLRDAGVADDRVTVLYDGAADGAAAWAFFVLEYLGHGDQVALLDGGLAGWVGSGRALVPGPPEAPERGRFTVDADPSVLAEAPPPPGEGRLLLDVRAPEAYVGKSAGAGRPGHIPGARSFHWRRALVGAGDPRLLPDEVLTRKLAAAGIDPGVPVVVYGQDALEGGRGYYLCRLLGHPTRLYLGGYRAWEAGGNPVVEGDQDP